MKRQFLERLSVLIVGLLTVAVFISVPLVDEVHFKESWRYPFFYATSLPPLYYVAVVYSVLLSLFTRNDSVRLFSLLNVAFLNELTPSIMLKNPWVPDQYPYLSEPFWLVRKGHIAPIHLLASVPGLGLMFSQFMLVTKFTPYIVSKLYPFLTVVLIILPSFILSKKLCGNGAVAPLLFLTVNSDQINTFHRNTYFFMLFSLLILLLGIATTSRNKTSLILSIIVYGASVISYPGSIIIPSMLIIFIFILVALAKLSFVSFIKNFRLKIIILRRLGEIAFNEWKLHSKLYLSLTTIFLVVFILWQSYYDRLDFNYIIHDTYNDIKTLMSPPKYIVQPQHLRAAGLKPVFKIILYVRELLTIILLSLGFSAIIYDLYNDRISFISILLMSLLILLAPFATSVGYEGQWFLLKFIRYVLFLTSLSATSLWVSKRDLARTMIIILIVVGLILIPITRYASIPYLHPTSREIKAATFVHLYYNSTDPIYYTEYPPFIRVLVGENPGWEFSYWSDNINVEKNNILITGRYMTRDGYYSYSVSRAELINSLVTSLCRSHNLVLGEGFWTYLFIKT